MSKKNPRIVLAGSVNSSRKTLEKLIQYNMDIAGVLALSPEVSENVSGYVDLGKIAEVNNLNFKYFKHINSDDTREFVRSCRPDYMFVIGLSQLVKKTLLDIPKIGSVGFHPTRLPEGRGRAAVAWLILGEAKGAATYFLMGEGMDDGPILAQEEFEVSREDYASDVIDKIMEKADDCLDKLLPAMKKGVVNSSPQQHEHATFLGKRNPEDGLIDWSDSAEEIHKLIRAVSAPLPGAYTYFGDTKIVVKRAELLFENNHTGVTGGLLKSDKKGVLVQTGEGLLRLTEISGLNLADLRVGKKLGLDFEQKFISLQKEIEEFKKLLKDNE